MVPEIFHFGVGPGSGQREVIRVTGFMRHNQESAILVIGPEVLSFVIRMKLPVSSSKLNFVVRTVCPCKWIDIFRGGWFKASSKDLARGGLSMRLEEVLGEETGWLRMELSKGGRVGERISRVMLRLHGMEYVKFEFIEV